MRPWRFFADGCHCNRETLATLHASALAVEDVERGRMEKMAPLIQTIVVGAAHANGSRP